MIKVWSSIVVGFTYSLLFLDNIWRQARMTIPPALGMSTYKILITGVVGSTPTGGKKFFTESLLKQKIFID